MCGRIVYVWDAATGRLLKKFDDGTMDEEVRHVVEKKRYNVPPASHLPVVWGIPSEAKATHSGEGSRVKATERPSDAAGRNRVVVARWGFPIPQRPNGVFNTRIETAAESPMWKGMLGSSHGLMVVQGFYEWRHEGRKEPYFIHRRDGQPMLLATLVGRRAVKGESALCTSVVTCAPNQQMADLHDRMPVIVEEAEADAWLHPEGDSWMDLTRPAGPVLAMHEVTGDVNSTKNDEPRLCQPIGQRRL